MATTLTNTFQVTRDDVIKASLRVLGVIGAGDDPTAEDLVNCSQAMNIMIKSWSKKGIPLWVTTEVQFPIIGGEIQYPLGPLGGILTDNSIEIVDAGTGGTNGTYALVITDVTGTGATGTYTVAGGSLSSITITNPGSKYQAPTLTMSQAGTAVATATPIGKYMDRPLKFGDAVIRDSYSNNVDLLLNQISRHDWVQLGNKNSIAVPTQFFFDSTIETATFNLTTVPPATTGTLIAQTQRQFYDMTNGTDNFDFPQAWFQAIKWGLVAEICTEYNIDKEMIPYFEGKAQTTLMEAFDESVEEPSVYFTYRDHN